MDALELIPNGRTQTNFGRNKEKLSCLEEAITGAGFDEHRALIIGAGLNVLPYTRWLESAILKNNPELQRPYSWEMIELAAILEKQAKPWTITVVDNSSEVCTAVNQQAIVLVDDFYSLNDPAMTDYARKFLASVGIRGNDDTKMEAINKALESRKVVNRLSIFKRVEIPSHVRDRIQVIQGSMVNLSKSLPTAYNVAICLNVMMHIPSGFGHVAAQSVCEVVAERGLALSDFELPGFRQIKVFRDENIADGDCGGSYTQITKQYISVKEPGVKPANAGRALQFQSSA